LNLTDLSDQVKNNIQIIVCMMLMSLALGCKKETISHHIAENHQSPAGSFAQTPNLPQRQAADQKMKILALGLTDLVIDPQFIEALYRTLPCDGWLNLDEFGGTFRTFTGGRNLYSEMNIAVRKYLQDHSNRNYVTPAMNGLVIEGVQYTADITIPYYPETNLAIPPIAAAGVDDAQDRITGYLVAGRDKAYFLNSATVPAGLDSIFPHDIENVYQAAVFSGGSAAHSSLRAQPITAHEAMSRPVIVISLGDGPDPSRENDPCYYLTNGGWSGGGSGGSGGGTTGCDPDDDCAYRQAPPNEPACSWTCDPNWTPSGQCLETASITGAQLNASHNSGANKSRVRFHISRMDPIWSFQPARLGKNGLSVAESRFKLENREAWQLFDFITYTDPIPVLRSGMLCQVSGATGTRNGFGLSPGGLVTNNLTAWWYARYWITIYEDDWWVVNNKEIHPPGVTYVENSWTHRVRATAATDLYYNGIIVLDNEGCASGFCTSIALDDGFPGEFLLRVGI
jgi:hypothetical protein